MNRRTFIQLASGAAACLAVPCVGGDPAVGSAPTVLPLDGRVITKAEWPDLFNALIDGARAEVDASRRHADFWLNGNLDDVTGELPANVAEELKASRVEETLRASRTKEIAEGASVYLDGLTQVPLTYFSAHDGRFLSTTGRRPRHMEQTPDGKWLYCEYVDYIHTTAPHVGTIFTVYEVSPDQSGIAPEHRAAIG